MSLKKKSTKIPKNVLNEMQDRGALVEKLEGEDLYSVTEIVYGDEAWKVYEHWGNTIDGDPRVGAVFAPPENIINSVLCPDDALGYLGVSKYHTTNFVGLRFWTPPKLFL